MKFLSRIRHFLLLLFLLSWGFAALIRLAAPEPGSLLMVGLFALYMFFPLISVAIATRISGEKLSGRLLYTRFRLNRWWAVAWLLPLVLVLLATGFSLLMPGVQFAPDMSGYLESMSKKLDAKALGELEKQLEVLPVHMYWVGMAGALAAGATINALFAYGEEAGWRGYMLAKAGGVSFWSCSLITGFFWGIWHAPLILMGHNYPEHRVAGIFLMIVFCLLLSPLFTYLALKSRSAVAAAVLHGTINACAALPLMVIYGGSDVTVGLTGLAGFLAILSVLAALYFYDRFISRERIFDSVLAPSEISESLRKEE